MAVALGCWVALAAHAAAAAAPAAKPQTHALASKRTYDVYLPPGDANGQALVLFLHGTGEPQLDRFRADWLPLLSRHKCVVAVPSPSGKLMWRYEDARYVMDAAADVQKRYRTDPKRVILMGISGGGQMALFLVDHAPDQFRAVVAVSANPVIIRGRSQEWFYPSPKTARSCPYFVVNHITQGAAIQYWRQVRAKREADGTSISILPAVGQPSHYLPPPKDFDGWLAEVLAGRHPQPIADPQKEAVARMLSGCVAALPKALAEARPAADANAVAKDGEVLALSVPAPAGFRRSAREDKADSANRPITQVRLEHAKWPIILRCDARRTDQPMADVLKAEEAQTIERGMLYQVYHAAALEVGKRSWQLKVGSVTYPDAKRGWVTNLFVQAAAPVERDDRTWLEVAVMDETQQPDAAELAGFLRTVLEGIRAAPASGKAGKTGKAAAKPAAGPPRGARAG